MKIINEFKAFIMRGNVLDLAVGLIIGSAFTAIVNSIVDDILMPVLGLFTGKINFSELYVSLDGVSYPTLEAAKTASAPVLAYGSFIQSLIQFVMLAFVVFLLVKSINRLRKKSAAPEEAANTKTCPHCKSEIHKDATKCAHCASEI